MAIYPSGIKLFFFFLLEFWWLIFLEIIFQIPLFATIRITFLLAIHGFLYRCWKLDMILKSQNKVIYSILFSFPFIPTYFFCRDTPCGLPTSVSSHFPITRLILWKHHFHNATLDSKPWSSTRFQLCYPIIWTSQPILQTLYSVLQMQLGLPAVSSVYIILVSMSLT